MALNSKQCGKKQSFKYVVQLCVYIVHVCKCVVFLRYGQIQSYGDPLVPHCLDKRGFTVHVHTPAVPLAEL